MSLTLEEILDRIEKKYAGPGFTADFFQESTLKEMGITDTASGKIFIKRPGMMRWEYLLPDRQIIITDSRMLWIYRPEDNQVMRGKAPGYFGDGRGASFLSDMRLVRKNFRIDLEMAETETHYMLRLVPMQRQVDLREIYLSVSKENFAIEQIITYNEYNDKTLIKLSQFEFNRTLDDSLFTFDIPKGADVLQLDR